MTQGAIHVVESGHSRFGRLTKPLGLSECSLISDGASEILISSKNAAASGLRRMRLPVSSRDIRAMQALK